MKHIGFICIGLGLWAWTAAAAVVAGEELSAPEYTLKAAFLYHFTKFGKWPDTAFEDAASPFVIGVLGEDPFGPLLDQTVKGKTVQDRPLEVRRFAQLDDLGSCHLLFVSTSERKHLGAVFQKLGASPVLTVGDVPE